MSEDRSPIHIVFQGDRRLARGVPVEAAAAARRALAGDAGQPVLIFEEATGRQVDLDPRADPVAPAPSRGPGRPKLGVTAREVTLLPRHWDWLAAQPGGASAVLRRLVEAASRVEDPKARRRQAQEAAHRFMTAMAGDRPGFEEALRALYAGEQAQFEGLARAWPADIADQTLKLAEGAFATD